MFSSVMGYAIGPAQSASFPGSVEELVGDRVIDVRNRSQVIEALKCLDEEGQRSWLLRFSCYFKWDETVKMVIDQSTPSLQRDSKNIPFLQMLSEIVEQQQDFHKLSGVELQHIRAEIDEKSFDTFAQSCLGEKSQEGGSELFDRVFINALQKQDHTLLEHYYHYLQSPSEKFLGLALIFRVADQDQYSVEKILIHYSSMIDHRYIYTAAFLAQELHFVDIKGLLENELEAEKTNQPDNQSLCTLM